MNEFQRSSIYISSKILFKILVLFEMLPNISQMYLKFSKIFSHLPKISSNIFPNFIQNSPVTSPISRYRKFFRKFTSNPYEVYLKFSKFYSKLVFHSLSKFLRNFSKVPKFSHKFILKFKKKKIKIRKTNFFRSGKSKSRRVQE